MKAYEAPKFVVNEFDETDIITASVPFDPIEDNPDE